MREKDYIDPTPIKDEPHPVDSRYVKKETSFEDELRLGPSKYLAMREVPGKNKNFREKLAKKGRPSPEDVVYGNFESVHTPHLFFKKNGVIAMATGKKTALGFQMDPEKGEITLSGKRLNLNFGEIDIRASVVELIVNRMIDIIIHDGDLRALIAGQVMLKSQTAVFHAKKWLRVETHDLAITTDVAQIPANGLEAVTAAAMALALPKGKITIDTEVAVLSATDRFEVNSENVRWGHEGDLPVSTLHFPMPEPIRGVARQMDRTTHFCPYLAAMVPGWIEDGSSKVKST